MTGPTATDRQASAATVAPEAAENPEVELAPGLAHGPLFATHPQPMWIHDAETLALLDVNEAAVALYGYPRAELLSMSVPDLEQPLETQGASSALMSANAAGTDRHRRNDGTPLQVRIHRQRVTFHGRPAVLALVEDLSERLAVERRLRQAYADLEQWAVQRTSELARGNADLRDQIELYRKGEEELSRERDLLQSLMDNVPDKIYFKDTESHFLRVNRAHATSLGAGDVLEVMGKTDFDYRPPEHARLAYADEQRIVRTGQPLVDKLEPVHVAGDLRWVSATKAPIKDPTGRVVGIVGISRDITERKLAEEELRAAHEKLSAKVEELERRTKETGLLSDMAELFQACYTLEEAYLVIIRIARLLFGAEAGFVGVLDSSRSAVKSVASWGTITGEHQFSPERCWALRRGRPHLVDETRSGLACQHIGRTLPATSLCIPMMAQGEALGILHLSHREAIAPAKHRVAITMAEQVAMALSNLKLRETLRSQSIRDPLTGLFNRRFMEESLEREVRRAARNQRPLGIIMLDLDYFKRFNDTFGHDAGDAVLRELGMLLRTQIRGEDIACRYGGEEFTLILPESSLETTRERAELLRESVRHMEVRLRNQSLGPTTLSLGVAVFPDHGHSGDSVLQAADGALYRAKAAGRDRVLVAD
jgi:diguanylate cyclase (GGDEF)-like protein/PAS domain S-box-containing protein